MTKKNFYDLTFEKRLLGHILNKNNSDLVFQTHTIFLCPKRKKLCRHLALALCQKCMNILGMLFIGYSLTTMCSLLYCYNSELMQQDSSKMRTAKHL